MAKELTVKTNVGEQVISRINSLCEIGFVMPSGFNYVNAIKMSMLKLQELKDKNGRPALEVCTPASISSSLFKMATMGLNAGLNQGYFITRNNQLCFDESYYGKTLMVKRHYPEWNPMPVVIREGDVFEYAIDAESGKKKVTKHEQKLENIDKDFKGGYMYLPSGELYIMTKKQILTAWSKSSNKSLSVHKEFDEKMVKKTIINTGLNLFINSTPDFGQFSEDVPNDEPDNAKTKVFKDLEEVDEQIPADVVDTVADDSKDEKIEEKPESPAQEEESDDSLDVSESDEF